MVIVYSMFILIGHTYEYMCMFYNYIFQNVQNFLSRIVRKLYKSSIKCPLKVRREFSMAVHQCINMYDTSNIVMRDNECRLITEYYFWG